MAIGIILGNFVPNTGPALQKGKFVGVSVPIAVGLLVMMYPILCKVRYETLHRVFQTRQVWIQIGFSIVFNWIIAPFFMLALAWAFLPDQLELRQDLILVGLARCIAMVLIWTGLAGGDSDYCAILVAINSILQMVLFAPMAVFFIEVISGDTATFDYSTGAKSVAVFLGIPLGAAVLTRFTLRWVSARCPWSLIGLLFTILVLFASQGHQAVHQIISVIRVAAPLIIYLALAATESFTAASNSFELAIAVAALASTVGPLIEVPVLLGLVYTVKFVAKKWGWKD
ncbi:sodium bile acid symporter family-domain-containing protein [Dipodascopsis uninucleata]